MQAESGFILGVLIGIEGMLCSKEAIDPGACAVWPLMENTA